MLVGQVVGPGNSTEVCLRLSDRLYGRQVRLARLRTAYDRVAAGGPPVLACLVGGPGVGKSALLDAFAREVRVAGARVLADPDPFVALGLDPATLPGPPDLPAPQARVRNRHAVRRLVAETADPVHPLVLVLDDLQGTDDAGLDLVEALLTDPPAGYLLVVGA
jgi:predicted ATPase